MCHWKRYSYYTLTRHQGERKDLPHTQIRHILNRGTTRYTRKYSPKISPKPQENVSQQLHSNHLKPNKNQIHTLQVSVLLSYHTAVHLLDSVSDWASPSELDIVQCKREPLFAGNIGTRNDENFNLVNVVDTFDIGVPRVLELGIQGPSVPSDNRIASICRVPANRE